MDTQTDAPRLQPYNDEAEQSVLGAILLDISALAIARGILTEEDFYKTTHRRIFAAMCAIADTGETIDQITLVEHLRKAGQLTAIGGAAYLAELLSIVPSATGVRSHSQIVYKHAECRRVILECEARITAAYKGQLLQDECVPEARRTDPWPVLSNAAYQGLVGEFVQAVAPHSEADPVALLLHTLIGAGCLVGRGPHVMVEHAPHHARLNVVFVGDTNERKGVACATPRALFCRLDPQWVRSRVKSGLASGEGLVYQVRDADGDDLGEPDKRLLVIEEELAGALKAMQRDGNTLSPRLRDAFDHGTMTPLTKRDRLTATDAHICVLAHVTETELLRLLPETERVNGLANRFLFAVVKRAQFLPDGGGVPLTVLDQFGEKFKAVIERARGRGLLERDGEARELWASIYRKIETPLPGMAGKISARAAAKVLRLSMLYSLLDPDEKAPMIRPAHILAALAVYDYSKASVLRVFGDSVGNPVADRLLCAIQGGPRTDTDLLAVLGFHGGVRKEHALVLLDRLGRVHAVKISTAGRPIRQWHLGIPDTCLLCKDAKKAN
jgi:hypothetical protein